MGTQSGLFEALEERRLLSASILIKGGTLIVTGTPRADAIIVSNRQANGAVPPTPTLFVTVNGRTRQLDPAGIRRVRVEAGAGDDVVTMSDIFFGPHPGRPELYDESLPSTILGGAGNDNLGGGSAADYISGGPGNDFIAGGVGDDTLDGDGNSDTIGGNEGKDLMRGGTGDDRFIMDETDRADGGDGTDFFSRTSLTGIINPSSTVNALNMEGFLETDQAPVIRFQKGFIVVEGTHLADFITLHYDSNTTKSVTIVVNDRLVSHIPLSGVKAIRIEGGNGDDTIGIGPESTEGLAFIPEIGPMRFPLQLDGGRGNDTLIAALGNDLLMGGSGNDVLAGSKGDDTLVGGDGNDVLRGNDGNDSLTGDNDTDSLDGGKGNDTVFGGSAQDSVIGGPGIDTFDAFDGPTEEKDRDAADLTGFPPGSIID